MPNASSEFTQPRIHFAEVTVAAAGTQYINAEIYKVSRPTLIDYICITEETATVNGAVLPAAIAIGQHTSTLPNLTVNWWVSDRGRTGLRPRQPRHFDNYIDAFRTAVLNPGGGAAATVQGVMLWRFREPWRFNPGNLFTIDWSYVVGNLAAAAPNVPFDLDVVFYGVSTRTHHRRIFEMTVPAPQGVGPYSGSVTQAEFISNLTDEPYDLHGMQIRVIGAAGGVPVGWPDLRQLNMVRFRIHPSQSEPFSDDLVPLLGYGVDQSPAGRSVWYEPTGGPLLLEAGSSIGWEVFNLIAAATGTNINFQVALVGRTAPNKGGYCG